jgi:hypothetical protein
VTLVLSRIKHPYPNSLIHTKFFLFFLGCAQRLEEAVRKRLKIYSREHREKTKDHLKEKKIDMIKFLNKGNTTKRDGNDESDKLYCLNGKKKAANYPDDYAVHKALEKGREWMIEYLDNERSIVKKERKLHQTVFKKL